LTPPPGSLSEPPSGARALRGVSRLLEAGVFLLVAGSAAAFGAVHAESYRWVWLAGALVGALALARAALAARLRRVLGWTRIALDAEGHWGSGELPRQPPRWCADLRPGLARAPMLLPGLCFCAWALLQLAPLPREWVRFVGPGRAVLEPAPVEARIPLSISPPDTRRGLAFLALALLTHAAAATAMATGGARRRLLRGLALLGLALAVVGLIQFSLRLERIYGVFAPLEGGGAIFGPFVNRNHFAGYMLMVIPAALAVAVEAFGRAKAAAGRGRGWRGMLLALDTRAGTSFVFWTLPVLATTAALVATQSRGGLLAFGLALVLLALRLRRGVIVWLAALALAAALSGLSLERLQARFARTGQESMLRILVWKDALERSRGLRWAGTGFNTYATAFNRTDAWALPDGATPWPPGASPGEVLGPRGGFRMLPQVADGYWYGEVHNDYLQVLVETGVPGLLLALWAAAAALRSARQDAWVLSALTGVLLHELVDFDLQIPALALLFVTLAAASARPRSGGSTATLDRAAANA
jgi:O-antigen ligase